jgi:hypothetical protein
MEAAAADEAKAVLSKQLDNNNWIWNTLYDYITSFYEQGIIVLHGNSK